MAEFEWDASVGKALFDRLTTPALLFDPSGALLAANPAATALLGAAAGDDVFSLLGTTPEAWSVAARAGTSLAPLADTTNARWWATALSHDVFLAEGAPAANQEGLLDPLGGVQLNGISSELVIRALEYQTLYMAEERLAHTDPLTGIANRRSFDLALKQALEEHRTDGTPFSLLMIDVDHFKKVNDTHGHLTGDAVLKGLGSVLGACVRPIDSLHRIGGEEFVMLVRASTAAQAVEIAERARESVKRAPLSGLNVTVSIGVVTCEEPGWTPQSLIEAGDVALYASKSAGRDRVSHYSEVTALGSAESA